MFNQRAPVGIYTNGQIHLVIQQLDQSTPATTDVENMTAGVNVLANRCFVYLPAFTPFGTSRRITSAEAVLAI
jgi:hypothetical protein